MEALLKTIVEKLPVRALSLVITFVLTWIAGLTIAGVTTHRSVEFFPPKIGTDTTLLKEISTLSGEVKNLTTVEAAYRSQIFAAQQKATQELLYIRRSISYGEDEAKANIARNSELLRNEDEKLMKAIEKLQSKITALEQKL